MEHIQFLFDGRSYWHHKPVRIEIDYKAKMEITFRQGMYLWTQFKVNGKESEYMDGSSKIVPYLELMNILLEGSDILLRYNYDNIHIEINNGKDIDVGFRGGINDIWTAIEINSYEMRWTHYPGQIKTFFDAINADDMKKLAFMEKLAESGLNPLKHLNFDEKKLNKAMKISERMKGNGNSSGVYEIIQEYEAAYDGFHNEEKRIWEVEGVTFFTERENYSGNSWSDSLSFAACDDDENCYLSQVRKSAIGKMLVQKRITPTIRKKLLRSADHEHFMNRVGAFVDSRDLNKIPDWLAVEMVERKLSAM